MSLINLFNQNVNRVIKTACTFNGTNEYFSRAFSAGDRRTFTLSVWAKFDVYGPSNRGVFGVDDNVGLDGGRYLVTVPVGIQFYVASGNIVVPEPSVSNFHHFVFRADTTQGTAANRVRVYIGGSLASIDSSSYPAQNADSLFNHSGETFNVGRFNFSSTYNYFDGTMADIYYCDGQSLGPDSFGKTIDGAWSPIRGDVTFGTNGGHYRFLDESDLGKDYSGNSNNLTLNNIDSTNWTDTDIP